MSDNLLIRDAAVAAMHILDRPATISEIYAEITLRKLYDFNTPTPEHVLRTTIRRHTANVERVDSTLPLLFVMTENEVYALNTSKEAKSVKSTATTGIKRIHRATDKEEIIQLLTSEQMGVFKEIWRLLMFAAHVGYRNSRREPLGSIESGKGIDQSTFGNSPSWPGVMYLIALADSGTADPLGGAADSEERRITAFQEYANGGLAILREFFLSRQPGLDGMIEFIDSQRELRGSAPDLDLSI